MLTISPSASEAIRQLVDVADLPETGGMRIAQGPETEAGTAVQLSLVEEPGDADHVVGGRGAAVYVDDQIAALLDDATLDADVHEGQVAFSLVREEPSVPDGSMNGGVPH